MISCCEWKTSTLTAAALSLLKQPLKTFTGLGFAGQKVPTAGGHMVPMLNEIGMRSTAGCGSNSRKPG